MIQKNIKNVSLQILNGLVFLHNLNIIHADLKPENILVQNNIYKIIDLGSSFIEKENKYYDYIQTRWYRSPDVLFNKLTTKKIDVWSFGCIVYELYYRYPLFTGKSSNKMKELILILDKKVNNENYLYIKENRELNSMIALCLKLKATDRIDSRELIKNEYFTIDL